MALGSLEERSRVISHDDFRSILQRHAEWLQSNGEAGEQANLEGANCTDIGIIHGDLRKANLSDADLRGADLRGANLTGASLIKVSLQQANLTGATVYGVAAWDLQTDGLQQNDLILIQQEDALLTVDNIEVAQFVYLMHKNEKLRNILYTITSKTVLILGRFTRERKRVLDALREALRTRNYVPS
jgi:uncharacterized protein YjbI with pentapeptide repeats